MTDGEPDAVVVGRFRVIRSGVGWGWNERLLDVHPIRFMRTPAGPPPCQLVSDQGVHALQEAADLRAIEPLANTPPGATRPSCEHCSGQNKTCSWSDLPWTVAPAAVNSPHCSSPIYMTIPFPRNLVGEFLTGALPFGDRTAARPSRGSDTKATPGIASLRRHPRVVVVGEP